MKKLWIILILCIVAFANAFYLVDRAYELRAAEAAQKEKPLASFCDVNDTFSCSRVLTHERAQFFGFPFPAVAFVVYPILAIIAILAIIGVCTKAYPVLAVMAAMGFMMNGYYIFQEIFYIKAFCPLCLFCTAIILSICILSIIGWREKRKAA